jgi:hypothetical protein
MVLDLRRASERIAARPSLRTPTSASEKRNEAVTLQLRGGIGAGRPSDDDGHAVGIVDPRIEPSRCPRFWPTDKSRASSVSGRRTTARPNFRRFLNDIIASSRRAAGSCDSSDGVFVDEPSSPRDPISLNDVVKDVLQLMQQ